MHRLLLIVLHWNRAGGLEAVTVEVARTFQELGWAVDVVAVYDGAPKTVQGFTSEPLAPAGRIARSLHHRREWRRSLASLLAARCGRYDLTILGHAALLQGLKPRGIEPAAWLWAYGYEVWGDMLRPVATRLGALGRIISISEFTAQQVRRWTEAVPVTVVPCIVDAERFVPAAAPEEVRRSEILICGRMSSAERYKGHDVLFRALPLAQEQCGFPLSITVVGDGDDRPRLEDLARELHLDDSIHFRGRLSLDELIDAYQHCGVFAMPSRVEERTRGPWAGEGFGIVYIEAAACGRPVIASRHGGAPETVIPGKTGLLVDPTSPDSVATAIASVLSDPASADAMGAAGRKMVEERFSRGRFRDQIAQLLDPASQRSRSSYA